MKNLVKVSAVAVITLLTTLSGQATVVLTPDQVPIDAYVNGSDGNQHFIQMFDFTFVGGYVADDAVDIIVITLPEDITVADVDVDGVFPEEIAVAYETANDPTFSISAADANSVTILTNTVLDENIAAGDRLWVMIPVVVAASASGTANQTVTFTWTNDAGAEGGPFSIAVSYKSQLSLMDWDDGFFEDAGADGRVETDDRGKFFPDGATSTVVDAATLPDFLIDEQNAGTVVEDGAITVANWNLYTTNAWGTNSELNAGGVGAATNEDDMLYYLWASQDGDLGKVNIGNSERVIDYDVSPEAPGEWPPAYELNDFFDATNPLNATDAQTGVVFSQQLPEGDWYFYITSSATGDWALGRSDTIEVRHRPVFADYAAASGQGVSFDDDFNGIYDMGTDGGDVSLVIESGGSLDKTGAFDPANNRPSVDVFWDIEDTDDNAFVQVYYSTNGSLTLAELVVSGDEPDEVVDALTGATRLDTTTIREESSTAAVSFNSFTSSSDFVAAGIYYVYVVLNDGKTQNLQIANETGANAAVPVTVTHAPFFAFHPYNATGAAITLESGDDQFFTISWGNPPVSGPTTNVDGDQDADAAGAAVIQLYAVEEDGAGGVGSGLFAALAGDPIDRVLLDAEITGGNAVLLATITDDGDDQSDNLFEWDFRKEALAAAETWYIYGVMTHGSDLIIAQLNSNGTPQPLAGPADDSPITMAHGDYLRPLTPYSGPPIELDANDIYELRWEAFNQDPTGLQEVQAVMVTEGVANPGNADYVVWVSATYQTTDFVWLLDGNDGGIPLATDGAAAAAGSATIQISDLDNTGAGAGAPASGNYEVYYFFNDDGATGFGATHTAVKAPGKIYLTGSTSDPSNFEIQPHKATLTTGDTLSFTVFAEDDGDATDDANMVSIFLNIPSASDFAIIDQDADTDGIQPFVQGGSLGGSVLMNTLTTNGSIYELNYLERRAGVTTIALNSLLPMATFEIAMISTLSDPFQDVEVTFDQSDPRVTNLYDADGSAQATAIPAVALTLRLAQQGQLTGFVDVEGRTDAGQIVNFFLTSTGASTPITDANYLAANNNDPDGTDGVQVTLDAGGEYSLLGIPNGEYDVRVTISGYLEQISSDITIVGLVKKDLHFTGGSKMFGGDAAGYDHDGDSDTFSLPDNRIDPEDTGAISLAFDATSSHDHWNAFADIDGDGTVGVNDLFMASRNLETDGDGIFYKDAAPYFVGNNDDAVVWLASEKAASGAVTFTVQAAELSSLSAYSVSLEVSPTDWEVLDFSDELSTYMSVINLGRFSGYDGIFASAAVGARAFRGSELALMAITLMPRVDNPVEPGLVAVAMVSGNGDVSSPIISSVAAMLPTTYTLSQNFPNPFNPTTSISFGLPASGYVKLAVYNILGREVRTLVSSPMEAGSYQTEWNSTDNIGRKISSGIYFYRLIVDNKVISTKKMIMLK